ncbi:uncharacterized protein LOC135828689 [Sycon ciliatum]|uniref:uncharacterized protein LOC135828689 n=1 Tax=Sycon ciliatum TaxID=27933 RepID=UPI0031F6AAAD
MRERVPAAAWRHFPGKDNPADVASRGTTLPELALDEKWKCGPAWLETSDGQDISASSMPEECRAEMSRREMEVVDNSAALLTTTHPSSDIGLVIDCTRFSNYNRLLRVTATVLKAIQRFKSKRQESESELTAGDLDLAEKLWINQLQLALPSHQHYKSWQAEFGLFVDNGLIRCGGRLQNSDLPLTTKHPYFLPKDHHVTDLIVNECHARVMHGGVKATLTEFRARFWLVKGRQRICQIIHSCRTCRRHDSKPYTGPKAPPLPRFRVEQTTPFSYVGVDYAGPLHIRNENGPAKVWICLFTCCTTRAVHLDVVSEMSTSAFMLAFRRLSARFGTPASVISDNAATFKAAARKLVNSRVNWLFNVEKAPWWGGIFERLIKSMKGCLKKVIGNAHLSLDELQTILMEVERTLNSRPLTYVSSEDTEKPLTPSYLLCGHRLHGQADELVPQMDPDFDLTPGDANRRLAYLDSILTHFWSRWRREYLVDLRDSHRSLQITAGDAVSLDDVVIIEDESAKRCQWNLGRVHELHTGRDGQVRAVTLQMGSGRKRHYLKRPVQHLYPVELSNSQQVDVEQHEDAPARRPRSQRRAAAHANEMRQALITNNCI